MAATHEVVATPAGVVAEDSSQERDGVVYISSAELEGLLKLNESLRMECAAADRELAVLREDQWTKLLLASLVGVVTGTLCGVTMYYVIGG